MKKIVIIILTAIIFCIGIKFLSYAYYQYSLTNILSGTIVVPKINTIELVNPNNTKETVIIDLQHYIKNHKQYLLTPTVTKEGIYFLAIGREKKTNPYLIQLLSFLRRGMRRYLLLLITVLVKVGEDSYMSI